MSPHNLTTVLPEEELHHIFPDHSGNGHNSGALSPIHYIIIVLIFYMGGLTILIIKYVQSENEEARYEQYYLEYVKRPQFDRPSLMKQIHDVNDDVENIDDNTTVTPLTKHSSFFHAHNKPNSAAHIPKQATNHVTLHPGSCCHQLVPYLPPIKSDNYQIVDTQIIEPLNMSQHAFGVKRISMRENYDCNNYFLNMKQTNL